MTTRISNEVKASVLEMFKNGAKKSEVAARYGISPRSVGRIIDADKQNNSNLCIKILMNLKNFRRMFWDGLNQPQEKILTDYFLALSAAVMRILTQKGFLPIIPVTKRHTMWSVQSVIL